MKTTEEQVIAIIKDKYPHFHGEVKFVEIADEFKHAANGMVTIDDRNFIYLITNNIIRIEEATANKLNKLSGLLPDNIRYINNPDDSFVYLTDNDETDILEGQPSLVINRLLSFPKIKEIIKVLKEYEEKYYQEYFFADFYLNNNFSVRKLELAYKEKQNG